MNCVTETVTSVYVRFLRLGMKYCGLLVFPPGHSAGKNQQSKQTDCVAIRWRGPCVRKGWPLADSPVCESSYNNSAKLLSNSSPKTLHDTATVSCYKLQSFGIICYTAIDKCFWCRCSEYHILSNYWTQPMKGILNHTWNKYAVALTIGCWMDDSFFICKKIILKKRSPN